MIPHEAFLSHSSLDQDFVTYLAEVLRRHGVPVWYGQTNILGAQQWHDEIGAALKRCDWFLLVLSANSVASMWVKAPTPGRSGAEGDEKGKGVAAREITRKRY